MRTHLTFFSAIIGLSALVACKTDKKEEPNPQTPEEVVFAVETGESQLPYLIIDTKGVDIKNEPKIPAELKVYVEKAAVQSAHIGIEYRGSTSFRLSDKKSFGIETWAEDGSDTEVSFLGFLKKKTGYLWGMWSMKGRDIFLTVPSCIISLGIGYLRRWVDMPVARSLWSYR